MELIRWSLKGVTPSSTHNGAKKVKKLPKKKVWPSLRTRWEEALRWISYYPPPFFAQRTRAQMERARMRTKALHSNLRLVFTSSSAYNRSAHAEMSPPHQRLLETFPQNFSSQLADFFI